MVKEEWVVRTALEGFGFELYQDGTIRQGIVFHTGEIPILDNAKVRSVDGVATIEAAGMVFEYDWKTGQAKLDNFPVNFGDGVYVRLFGHESDDEGRIDLKLVS